MSPGPDSKLSWYRRYDNADARLHSQVPASLFPGLTRPAVARLDHGPLP